MAQFTLDQYNENVHGSANQSVRIGFFKLSEGSEALIRINAGTDLNHDLAMCTVHPPVYQKKYEGLGSGFTPVSCLNGLDDYENKCPFCRAAAENHETIGKAQKKVYIQILAAFKDPATGSWTAPTPFIWERPAGFARDLAAKVKNYGELRKYVFKVTRTGVKKDTRFSLDYIPMLDKTELIPNDFSAFNGFNIAKHSYWEKSAADMEKYIKTGTFSDEETSAAAAESRPAYNASPARTAPAPTAAPDPTPYVAPVAPAPAAPASSPASTSTIDFGGNMAIDF